MSRSGEYETCQSVATRVTFDFGPIARFASDQLFRVFVACQDSPDKLPRPDPRDHGGAAFNGEPGFATVLRTSDTLNRMRATNPIRLHISHTSATRAHCGLRDRPSRGI